MMRPSTWLLGLLPLSLLAALPIAVAQSSDPTTEQIEQLFEQGDAAQAQGDYFQAAEIWRVVLQLDPNNAAAYTNLGNALYSQNEIEDAIVAYRRAIEIDQANNYASEITYNSLGDALFAQGQIEEAIDAYNRAIEIEPDFAIAHKHLGDVFYYNLRDLDAAIIAYRRATELNPNYFQAFVGLGNALDDIGRSDEAIDAYNRAIEIEPNYTETYVELGIALIRRDQIDEAIAAYDRAIQLAGGNYPRAYAALGDAFFLQGRLDDAIVAYNQAGDYAPAYEGLAATYRQIVNLNPNDASAWIELGFILEAQDKSSEAVAAFHRAIDINPNDSINVANAYNGLGIVFLNQNQLDEAIAAFRQVTEVDPNYAFAYCNLGIALARQGEWRDAIEAYRKALTLPDQTGIPTTAHALAYHYLGIALQEEGELEEAIEAYQQSLAIDPNFEPAQSNLSMAQSLVNPPIQASQEDDSLNGVLRSIVIVQAETLLGISTGTGWVVKREGDRAWIITNRHVVVDEDAGQPSDDVIVALYSQTPPYTVLSAQVVEVTGENEPLDMALLEVTGLPEDIEPLELSLGEISREAPIRIIGHPFSLADNSFLYWSTVSGQVSNYTDRQLLLETSIGGGVSGAPVLDRRNNMVIGLVSEVRPLDRGTADFGFAYPTTFFIQKLQSWGVF
ncbi:MAG: tetratricopeptide repeat protein [Cyanobacteria bacterium CRU_2_1]|nr:tetratricopeptide repeat protein [Cyanobacteria bacterium RU_5_0]NJR63791.1 tetratricopeptide repeat protein [Cyanobacteria bacterium CRU_2_1]